MHNVQATGEFVLNAAVEPLAEQVNQTSRKLPPGENEAEQAGLRLLPSVLVRPLRVAESPVHLECKLLQVLPIGTGPGAANLVIGEVLLFHIDDAVLDADLHDLHGIDDRAAADGDEQVRLRFDGRARRFGHLLARRVLRDTVVQAREALAERLNTNRIATFDHHHFRTLTGGTGEPFVPRNPRPPIWIFVETACVAPWFRASTPSRTRVTPE